MSYNLFLDDTRVPVNCRNYPGDESIYDAEEFLIARNFDRFYEIIKREGLPKFVSFDYDLNSDKDGLDCARFLKFECDELGVDVPEYRVHSQWPGIKSEFQKILNNG